MVVHGHCILLIIDIRQFRHLLRALALLPKAIVVQIAVHDIQLSLQLCLPPHQDLLLFLKLVSLRARDLPAQRRVQLDIKLATTTTGHEGATLVLLQVGRHAIAAGLHRHSEGAGARGCSIVEWGRRRELVRLHLVLGSDHWQPLRWINMAIDLRLRLDHAADQTVELRVLYYTVANALRLACLQARLPIFNLADLPSQLHRRIALHSHFLLREAIIHVLEAPWLHLVAWRIECLESETIWIRPIGQLLRQSLLLATIWFKLREYLVLKVTVGHVVPRGGGRVLNGPIHIEDRRIYVVLCRVRYYRSGLARRVEGPISVALRIIHFICAQ